MLRDIFKGNLFEGKNIFITGGGSGINLGIAHSFASLGANIGICGRTQEKLQKAASELATYGNKVFFDTADVRDADRLREVIDRSSEELGSLDVLVAAAAGNFLCTANKMSTNAFKSVIDIDLLGSFNACNAAFPHLKSSRGSIIFISAGMSYMPYVAQCHVGAAKAGIDNLMKNLALEWGRYGIRSNSIVPGPIADTEGMSRLAPGDMAQQMASLIPLGRMGEKSEIGNAAVFLASPLASYITGTVLVVDGGQNLPGSGGFTQMISQFVKQKG